MRAGPVFAPLLAVLFTACGGAATVPPTSVATATPTSASAVTMLARSLWRLASIDGVAAPTTGQGAAGISFDTPDDEAGIEGTGPCDSFAGSFHLEGASGVQIRLRATTHNACDAEIMMLEAKYLAALNGATMWSISGTTLTLSGASTVTMENAGAVGLSGPLAKWRG